MIRPTKIVGHVYLGLMYSVFGIQFSSSRVVVICEVEQKRIKSPNSSRIVTAILSLQLSPAGSLVHPEVFASGFWILYEFGR